MKRSMLKVVMVVAVLALGGGFALPVQATTLDFTLGLLHGGTVSFAGGNAPLVGAGIDVSFVVDKDTANLPIPVSGVLSFSTGPLTGWSSTEWVFGGGSSSWITITGAVPLAGINDPTTVLLSGTFDNAQVFNISSQYFNYNIAAALFRDTKNPLLLDYFHLPADTPFVGTLNLSFLLPIGQVPPLAFTSTTMGSGDLFNIPVPLPSTVLLLGSGLVGLGLLRFRRRQPKS